MWLGENEVHDGLPTMLAGVVKSCALHHEAPEAQIHGRLEPQPGDIVVRKTCVGAFSTTDLDQQLEDRVITTLILGGVISSGVLLSIVREAADRDYRIYSSYSSPTPALTVTRTFTLSSPRRSCPCRRTSSPSPTSPALRPDRHCRTAVAATSTATKVRT